MTIKYPVRVVKSDSDSLYGSVNNWFVVDDGDNYIALAQTEYLANAIVSALNAMNEFPKFDFPKPTRLNYWFNKLNLWYKKFIKR